MSSAAATTRNGASSGDLSLQEAADFDRIGEVRVKGFTESTEVFIARERSGARPPR